MYLIISTRNQAVNDFVKKKKVFLKGSVFKKKVLNARKRFFLLLAYLNKNSKR